MQFLDLRLEPDVWLVLLLAAWVPRRTAAKRQGGVPGWKSRPEWWLKLKTRRLRLLRTELTVIIHKTNADYCCCHFPLTSCIKLIPPAQYVLFQG
jgi:hypothetical protein